MTKEGLNTQHFKLESPKSVVEYEFNEAMRAELADTFAQNIALHQKLALAEEYMNQNAVLRQKLAIAEKAGAAQIKLLRHKSVLVDERVAENTTLRQKLALAEESMAQLKFAAIGAEQRALNAEQRAVNTEMQRNKDVMFWQEMASKANLRAALADKQLKTFMDNAEAQKKNAAGGGSTHQAPGGTTGSSGNNSGGKAPPPPPKKPTPPPQPPKFRTCFYWDGKGDLDAKVDQALKTSKTPLAKLKTMCTMVGVDPTLVNQKGTEYKTLWRAILMIVHEDKRRPGLSPEREALFNCICKRVNELNSKA